ncbi:MAG: type II toxin-antitoxin system HicB family antitoxin [Chlorobium sp.]|nr:MAG: type II toxin-antitoxin system HicB family antitoxin [Chlorobium sp.]
MEMQMSMIIYWSKEDNAFIVEVPALPGCMAEGGTYEEAVMNAQRVIEEWVETAHSLGRPVPKPQGMLMNE